MVGQMRCRLLGILGLIVLLGNTERSQADPEGFMQLAAGDQHTCGLHPSGRVSCWGSNARGQLGRDDTSGTATPVQIPELEGIVQIGAGGAQTCGILEEGTVWCWGADGEISVALSSRVPVPIEGVSEVTDLSLGRQHGCFVGREWTLHCQGSNLKGQLGDLRFGPQSEQLVDTGLIATQVEAGAQQTCGISAGGVVQCWGAFLPEMGSYRPERIGIQGVVELATGQKFACGRLQGGQVYCWGADEFGQLGNGSLPSQGQIVPVNGITDAVAIAVGDFHGCAVLRGGSVRCWGANLLGQLGNGSTQSSSIPVQVQGIDSALGITAGQAHSCAVVESGSAWCWGYNSVGQLGNGGQDTALVPVEVIR